jgi:hypothetical protein
MALQSPAGGFYEFDQACNAGALLAFHVLEHCPRKTIVRKKTGKTSEVDPVRADIVILEGGTNPALARTVVRGDEIIGNGIVNSLRRVRVGNDGIFRMAWGQGDNGAYPQANAVGPEDMELATRIFNATNQDPYSAAEQVQPAAPAALQSPPPVAPAPVQPAPVQYAPPVEQTPAPAAAPWQQPAPVQYAPPVEQTPAPAAAPWQQPAAAPQAQPVGGPQGPQWDPNAQPAAQPVAAGANGAAAAGPLW